MFDSDGHFIDDPLLVVTTEPDFSNLGLEPQRPVKKIYISGPISGIDRATYLANFARAEIILKAKGYKVVNPTRLPPSRWLWIYRILGYRLTLLYDLWHLFKCDGIVLLDGWRQSKGARLERATAIIFDIKEIAIKEA